jgi:acetolactate synthase-1/2/3 large subunit
MRVADYIASRVAEPSVSHVFMVPGGAAMHLNDAFGRAVDITCVANLHEQASAIAAEAHARISGGLGVVLVTAGPGATNTITGLAGAWLDSTPVLFLSGQVKTADLRAHRTGVRQYGVQEIDVVRLVEPLTKYAVTVTDPQTIRFHLEKALHLAMSGRRGPVWLDLPLDVQGAEVDPDALEGYAIPAPPQQLIAPTDAVDRILEMMSKAQRPVLLAGNGVRAADAVNEFQSLAEHWNVPVLTTWLGMDLMAADHPLYFGRPGGMAPRGANFTVQNCDFLLVVGSRLDLGLVGYSYENFARAAKKVIVDVDPAELEKFPTAPELAVSADARELLTALLARNDEVGHTDRSAWLEQCRRWKQRYPLLTDDHKDPSKPLSAYWFSDALTEQMGPEDIIVPGSSGFACEIFLLLYRCKQGQRIFHNRGTGSMGFGLPASIGACLAAGGLRTICVDGDGGIQMNIQELETVKRLNLPVKLFVINNDGYASIRTSQAGYFQQLVCADRTSGLTLPEIARIAEAYGLPFTCIDSPHSLPERLAEVLSTPGPMVCEVVVRPDEPRIPRLASFRKPDGSMVSRPIEDLFPFLDRDEFRANMMVPILAE